MNVWKQFHRPLLIRTNYPYLVDKPMISERTIPFPAISNYLAAGSDVFYYKRNQTVGRKVRNVIWGTPLTICTNLAF